MIRISLPFRFRLPQSFEAHMRNDEGKTSTNTDIKLEDTEKLKKLWETIRKEK